MHSDWTLACGLEMRVFEQQWPHSGSQFCIWGKGTAWGGNGQMFLSGGAGMAHEIPAFRSGEPKKIMWALKKHLRQKRAYIIKIKSNWPH